MRETIKTYRKNPILLGIVSFLTILILAMSVKHFTIISQAQSQGKVIAGSAKIRKDADKNSEVVGSASKDAVVTINHQKTASDNSIWYQIYVDADTLGYIRSDLVQITDGSTPPVINSENTSDKEESASATQEPSTAQPSQSDVNVTEVEPVSANIKSSAAVRVRKEASTSGEIVTTVENGYALTVVGQTQGADSKTWYQVKFMSNNAEVTGFIRSDFLSLSGEIVPVTSQQPSDETQEDPSQQPEDIVSQTKDYEIQIRGEKWYLLDNVNGVEYDIKDTLDKIKTNEKVYEESQQKVKSQKGIIVVFVILVMVLVATLIFLFLKLKDIANAAYISSVERETLNKRKTDQNKGKKPSKQPYGAEKPKMPKQQGGKPVRVKETENSAGNRADNIKVEQIASNARPSGARNTMQGQGRTRTEGKAPVKQGDMREMGAAGRNTGTRQSNTSMQGRNMQDMQRTEPQRASGAEQNPGWKSKNFMTDDDEFEFKFLNSWEGKEDR